MGGVLPQAGGGGEASGCRVTRTHGTRGAGCFTCCQCSDPSDGRWARHCSSRPGGLLSRCFECEDPSEDPMFSSLAKESTLVNDRPT